MTRIKHTHVACFVPLAQKLTLASLNNRIPALRFWLDDVATLPAPYSIPRDDAPDTACPAHLSS